MYCVYPTWCRPSGTTSLLHISVAQPQTPATMRAGRLSRHAPQPLKQTYVRRYSLTIMREIILHKIKSCIKIYYTWLYINQNNCIQPIYNKLNWVVNYRLYINCIQCNFLKYNRVFCIKCKYNKIPHIYNLVNSSTIHYLSLQGGYYYF